MQQAAFLQQLIQLLTEPPGNLIYHLVTLFAVQAVLAIAYPQRRREPENEAALRTMAAAGGIFSMRLLLLAVGLLYGDAPARAVAILPPLEQAINAVTAVLLVWAMVPPPRRAPRLNDTLLVAALVLSGVMVLFFLQEWQTQVAQGTTAVYNDTVQATLWSLWQIVILLVGLAALLFNPQTRRTLHPLIVGLLLLAHAAHFWLYPEIIPSATNVPYWIRLGHFVVFPLWAAAAYQQALAPLLTVQSFYEAALAQLGQGFEHATQVITAATPAQTVDEAIALVDALVETAFVAIGLPNTADRAALHFSSNLLPAGADDSLAWEMRLDEWPGLRVAMVDLRSVELAPDGLGARQLHELTQFLALDAACGPVLLHPLHVNMEPVGVLLLAAAADVTHWSTRYQQLLHGLAGFVAQAIVNSRPRPAPEPAPPPLPARGKVKADPLMAKTLARLESAQKALEQERARRARAEAQLRAAQEQARKLARLEETGAPQQVADLERQIAVLRSALEKADAAVLAASDASGDLNSEWVVMTITRYSAQLDEAQARIAALEAQRAALEAQLAARGGVEEGP
jgi:hypothetical protein